MTPTSTPFTILATLALCASVPALRAQAHDRKPRVERPAVPANLEVDASYRPFLLAHADGTQNYTCLPSGNAMAWVPFGPQATLYDDDLQQVMTHYLSANPAEGGTARATWRSSRDTSTVWAVPRETSIDPAFVTPGAIPWLKLEVVGAMYGPDGGKKLVPTAFIQRVHTVGGAAPSTGCATGADLGRRAFVPYATDYVFYR